MQNPAEFQMNREKKIESIVCAIGTLNGAFSNPESDAHQLNSPLLLRSFARPGKHEVDEQGRRIFPSMLSGFKASTYDALLKISGNSRAGLKPATDCLENLLRVYGITELLGQKKAVNYLKRSLKNENISVKTPLSYFLESDLVVQLLDKEQ